MPDIKASKGRFAVAACLAALTVVGATAAHATACRITDFTDRTLSSLTEQQRASFITEMTPVEYKRIKAAPQGSPDFDLMVSVSTNLPAARALAFAKLASYNLVNVDDYRKIWASDFLTDKGLQDLGNCISSRQPGLLALGRSESPSQFHLTLTHLTPIGIEKITTRLVASHNIANVAELEAFLADIGPKDNYRAVTFPLKIADPAKRAVVLLRAGWETPVSVYIPPSNIEAARP